MGLILIRIFLLGAGTAIGYGMGRYLSPQGWLPYVGLGAGFVVAAAVLALEQWLRRVSVKVFLGGIVGLVCGFLVASLLTHTLATLPTEPGINMFLTIFVHVIFGYLGIMIGVKKSERIDLRDIRRLFQKEPGKRDYKILDTSVIIDGRIADICETGFVEGTLVVPQFVLRELQSIADSSDGIKRNRGRRGLEVLHRIQKSMDVTTEITDHDFPKIKEVDGKLVALAKQLVAKILTNDFNLNKVAELQGVSVLNINELANAMKPVVLPGELMIVYVLKEGKEYGQGIAYLDDGTMVVVDNARKYLGNNVEVAVTSVLQTTAGRMIFTKLKEDVAREKEEVTR